MCVIADAVELAIEQRTSGCTYHAAFAPHAHARRKERLGTTRQSEGAAPLGSRGTRSRPATSWSRPGDVDGLTARPSALLLLLLRYVRDRHAAEGGDDQMREGTPTARVERGSAGVPWRAPSSIQCSMLSDEAVRSLRRGPWMVLIWLEHWKAGRGAYLSQLVRVEARRAYVPATAAVIVP